MKAGLISSIFFISLAVHSESFIDGTIIETQHKAMRVEELDIHSHIWTIDVKALPKSNSWRFEHLNLFYPERFIDIGGARQLRGIGSLNLEQVSNYLEIRFKRSEKHDQRVGQVNVMNVAPDQSFYEPAQDKWIKAKDLRNSMALVDANGRVHTIQSISSISRFASLYRLALPENHHLFYVINDDLVKEGETPLITDRQRIYKEFGWAMLKPTLIFGGLATMMTCIAMNYRD